MLFFCSKRRIFSGKKISELVQFIYESWDDEKVPASTGMLLELYKTNIMAVRDKYPIVVISSSGTATFVAAYFCYELFLKNQIGSVTEGITCLRYQKYGSVQNPSQFIYVHLLVVELIEFKTNQLLPEIKANLKAVLSNNVSRAAPQ
uniref:Protein-tyrosine phosphatase catalytic domain-containing protein n=1 Tax=Panagrolaimus davidi TaxID=227884 RepID=A0A914QJU0_9BILA